jgi:ceramide glucosyltransferase
MMISLSHEFVIQPSSDGLNGNLMTTLTILAGSFCALAIILHCTSIIIVIARHRMPDAGAGLLEQAEGVSIVRPVCGLENFSEETLASAFHLDYPNYEIIFCAAHAGDPVLPLVGRLIAAHPNVPARILVGNDHVSTNPKLNNTVKGWEAARHEWIIMADSNVLMPRDYVRRLLAAWDASTGLVCSPPIGCAPDGAWAELECAFLNSYQARWQCFAASIGIGFAQGKTMLWRKEILDRGGGIRALASEVAEDAASTKLVSRQGLRVRLVARPFQQPLGHRTVTEVWRRQVRWARLRRDTFRLFFAVEIFAGAIPPLIACAIFATTMGWPIMSSLGTVAFTWYLAEAVLAYAAGWDISLRSVALCVLRDLVLPALWFAAWIGDEFVWRGNVMRVAHRSPAA